MRIAWTLFNFVVLSSFAHATEQTKYIECAALSADLEGNPIGSVWTFALQTDPKPKLLERIELGRGQVRLLGRLSRMTDEELTYINKRGAKNVTVWEAETAAAIKGKVDAKFYTFDTCTTLWACRNSFRFSREDLTLWVAHGSSLGSPTNWQETSYDCAFVEEDQFTQTLIDARAQITLNAQIEQEVLTKRVVRF